MSKAELVRRYVLFLFGLFVNSLGIALTTRANLGTSPITSVPYVLSIRFPLSLGMFTLFFSLLAIYGIKSRKWWWFVVGVLAINLLNADYANTGVILTLIFYLCRNKPWLGAALTCAMLAICFTTPAWAVVAAAPAPATPCSRLLSFSAVMISPVLQVLGVYIAVSFLVCIHNFFDLFI